MRLLDSIVRLKAQKHTCKAQQYSSEAQLLCSLQNHSEGIADEWNCRLRELPSIRAGHPNTERPAPSRCLGMTSSRPRRCRLAASTSRPGWGAHRQAAAHLLAPVGVLSGQHDEVPLRQHASLQRLAVGPAHQRRRSEHQGPESGEQRCQSRKLVCRLAFSMYAAA